MPASAAQVMANVSCYNCFGGQIKPAQLARLALLSAICKEINVTVDTTPQALIAQGKCFACYSMAVGDMMELALLQMLHQLLISGISGVTGVYTGTTALRNATTPLGNAALWILTDSDPVGVISWWDGATWN